jgi:hypothetical protein
VTFGHLGFYKLLKLKIDSCAVVFHAFRNERYLTEEQA